MISCLTLGTSEKKKRAKMPATAPNAPAVVALSNEAGSASCVLNPPQLIAVVPKTLVVFFWRMWRAWGVGLGGQAGWDSIQFQTPAYSDSTNVRLHFVAMEGTHNQHMCHNMVIAGRDGQIERVGLLGSVR